MRKLSFASLCFSALILLVSCEKEGPVGPPGPMGPAGTNGTVGAQGPQGPAGTANVIYSTWTDDETLDWEDDETITGVPQKIATWSAAQISQQVVDSGVVLVYARAANNGPVSPLPATFYAATGAADQFSYSINVGALQFTHRSTDAVGVFVTPAVTDVRFRYIIIPGGTPGSRMASSPAAGYTVEQLKAMTYEQVVALLRIPK